MLATPTAQQSLRRLATTYHPSRFAVPAAIAVGLVNGHAQRRSVAVQAVSGEHARNNILANQRLNRPVAPHLAIYRPQITWYGSALNRITGCTLSGLFYLYGALYLAAPALGWHVESAVLATSFAAWPFALQILTKLSLALPFTYHCLNGVRHLVWDTASMITNNKVAQSGWFVVGASLVSALALCFV